MRHLERENLRYLLAKTNPFMMRTETGKLCIFHDAKEAYQLCLHMLWAEFPAGFFDVTYFMMKYQNISEARAASILGYKEYCFCRLWDDKDTKRLPLLRIVLGKLLQVSGCTFDEAAFGDAVKTLDMMIEKQGVRIQLSKLNNLRIIEK